MAIAKWAENGFNVLMIGVILYNLSKVPALVKNTQMPNGRQRVITQAGPLLLANGTLAESGWSRLPLKELNRAAFGAVVLGVPRLSALKYRKLDEYAFFGSEASIVVTLYETAFRSFFSVLRYDFADKTLESEFYQRIGSLKSERRSETFAICAVSSARMEKGDFIGVIETVEDTGTCITRIEARLSSKKHILISLEASLLADSVVDAIRISPDGRHWVYSLKKLATGTATVDDNKELGMATMHLARSLGYYKSASLFGTAAARIGDTDFALNFGILPAHSATATSEDSFTLNNTVHKLEPLEIRFDRLNLMNGLAASTVGRDPLAAENECSGADFVFQSHYTTRVGSDYFFVKNRMEVVFGTVTGRVTDGRGVAFHFEDVPGYVRILDLKA